MWNANVEFSQFMPCIQSSTTRNARAPIISSQLVSNPFIYCSTVGTATHCSALHEADEESKSRANETSSPSMIYAACVPPPLGSEVGYLLLLAAGGLCELITIISASAFALCL
jgi:hypothetical protein